MDRAEVSDLGEKEADFATSTGLRWSQVNLELQIHYTVPAADSV